MFLVSSLGFSGGGTEPCNLPLTVEHEKGRGATVGA